MKKTILLAAALLAALGLRAQTIRTNYRSEGMTHISTQSEKTGDLDVRVELVGFPDGSAMYQLFIDLRQKKAKGKKLTKTEAEFWRKNKACQLLAHQP